MPKHLNTKYDYLQIIELFPREQWEPKLTELLESRFAWRNDGIIASEATGIEDDTHKVIEDEEGNRVQMSMVEDENARLFRLEFTVEEINQYLA